jgi:ferritin-like metal-binding protein YciE
MSATLPVSCRHTSASLAHCSARVVLRAPAQYGSLCAIGKQLGFTEGVKLRQATLEEEKATDLKLSEFAAKAGNEKATAA